MMSKIFVIRGLLALCPRYLRAHNNIIAGIRPAEVQVCTNWVALRKSVILLVPLIY